MDPATKRESSVVNRKGRKGRKTFRQSIKNVRRTSDSQTNKISRLLSRNKPSTSGRSLARFVMMIDRSIALLPIV